MIVVLRGLLRLKILPNYFNSSEMFLNSKFCRIPIRIITWGPSATRLVTGDASGAVLIWKVSIGPQSVPKNSHRLTFVVIFQFTKRFQLALVLHRS